MFLCFFIWAQMRQSPLACDISVCRVVCGATRHLSAQLQICHSNCCRHGNRVEHNEIYSHLMLPVLPYYIWERGREMKTTAAVKTAREINEGLMQREEKYGWKEQRERAFDGWACDQCQRSVMWLIFINALLMETLVQRPLSLQG